MPAALKLLTIVLLLSCVLSRPAAAEYPFDSSMPAGPAMPGAPGGPGYGGGAGYGGGPGYSAGGVSRGGLFGGGGVFSRGRLFGRRSMGGNSLVGNSSDSGSFAGGSYSANHSSIGGNDPGNTYSGNTYSGNSYSGGTPGGSPYDVVPYEDVLAEDFAPGGGPQFNQPLAQNQLFGFGSAYWPGYVSGTLQPGLHRFIYGGEFFQPLYQDGHTMWYFDFRGRGDDHSASEFNTGTGVRILSEPGWIFGAYTYWDHLRSQHGNHFNQGTLGVEAMSVMWDARFNVYFPGSGAQYVGPATAVVSNGNILVSSALERAYWGMDFEVGNLLWTWGPQAQQELRGFLALYHFDNSAPSTPSITGPRARLEYRYYDLPYFGPGSRFTCGLSVQGDEVRHGELYAFARLRIPLDPWAHSRQPLSRLHRRMLDRVVRDVDIVTGTSRRTERALNPITNREIRGYAQIDANTPHPQQLLAGLDTDSVVVVDGRAGVIHAAGGYQLQSGQAVIGAGTAFSVEGASSGRRAVFNPGGTRPTLDFGMVHTAGYSNTADDPAPQPGLQMNNHTQFIGVDIRNVDVGVSVSEADDVLIHDVSVSDFATAGIDVSKSTNVRLNNVLVRDAWMSQTYDTLGRGINVRNSSGVLIADSQIEDTTSEGIHVKSSQDVAIRRTSIRDTKGDGIRLVETHNVLIDQVEMKHTGEIDPYQVSFMPLDYKLSAITLRSTENTIISDTTIHGSDGNGIFGYQANSTLLKGLEIAGVENGIIFRDSRNVVIIDSKIVLPDEPYRAIMPSGDGPQVAMAGYVPSHSGISVWDATGDVVIAGNDIRGGYAGAGIRVDAGQGTTNLHIEHNHIEKQGSSHGIGIQSGIGNSLQAAVSGNTVSAPEAAFWLQATSRPEDANANISKQLTITDNQWDGEFQARILETAHVEMTVDGNHMGGDPMGAIIVGQNSRLDLRYSNNTSTPGAEVMRLESNGGKLFAPVGGISGNDHQPNVDDVQFFYIDTVQ